MKPYAWYLGFFLAAIVAGVLLRLLAPGFAGLGRTLALLGAGVAGGVLAEWLVKDRPEAEAEEPEAGGDGPRSD